MKVLILVCLSLVLAAVAADHPGCVSIDLNARKPNACTGRSVLKDRMENLIYCCDDEAGENRPVKKRTIRNGEHTYVCECLNKQEFCEKFPFFCPH